MAKTAVALSGRDATCSTAGKEGESEDLEPQPLRAENAETPWDREPNFTVGVNHLILRLKREILFHRRVQQPSFSYQSCTH
jgi:hypothetical protein